MKKFSKILSVFSIVMIMFSTVFAGEMIDYSIDEDICRFSDYVNLENTLPYIRVSGGRMEVDIDVLKSGMAFANGNIEVKENMSAVQILTAADTIRINGSIENAILLAPSVIIDGDVTGTVAIFSTSVSLGKNSNVKGDILACTPDFKTAGKITGNVILIAENVTVEESAKIDGSLRFESNTANISEDAIITGKVYCKAYTDVEVAASQKDFVQIIKLEEVEDEEIDVSEMFTRSIPFLKIVVSSLIFAGLYLLIFSKKNIIEAANNKLKNKSYITLLIGLGFIFVMPLAMVLCVILAIMGLGCIAGPIFVVVLALFILAVTLKVVVTALVIVNAMLKSKFSEKLQTNLSKFVFVAVVFISLYLLEYVPFIGGLITYLYLMISLGYLFTLFIPSKNKEESKPEVIDAK